MLCFVVTTLSCKYKGHNSSLSVDKLEHLRSTCLCRRRTTRTRLQKVKNKQHQPKLGLTIIKEELQEEI